ncbi:MAG: ATP-binding cassette domain-containing protein [Chloroflexi bacterium AL-W]|nr:ATP-binding cassette domain-containing protein [Chloroflexi bacterium AL-N1]NOK67435.1 ATP-binding cassette domain-containing protein [Chloroflexi bacterium AL-N10]NOK75073.1 ATP-binding cassette domain-containing protein [Chloroflexi bacterium AL-N5]NOK81860.1 ATP-binding cassette domain-containing protein [Chloroflexi bacterium AL-W]NOK89706.1 ATP-binding cassette domain-containing protein [Chloroflexi bacterium AL-N15]
MSQPLTQQPLATDTLLDVRDLKMHFPIRKGLLQRQVGQVKAVDGVSFDIKEGETLSLVGESGCGKTTTGRCIVRALKQRPTGGSILFRAEDGHTVDLAKLNYTQIHPYRKEIQMVFQDPFSSLNPRMSILEIVGEPLLVNGIAQGKELEERVAEVLRKVKMSPDYMRRYPHAFSGGQRQRIGIARALSVNPRLIVADEAVSALDVSVQAQILNLMQELQEEYKLTYLFVAHDLSVVRYISDRVAVMYVGQVVELAKTDDLFNSPKHPYTEALLANVPKPDPRLRSKRTVLSGEVADPANPPGGCYFHPRCPHVKERCKVENPALRKTQSDHYAACHYADELELKGVIVPKTV